MQLQNSYFFRFLKKNLRHISANALGLSTLVVGECPLGHVTVGTTSCKARIVTKTNVALARRLYPAGASIRS